GRAGHRLVAIPKGRVCPLSRDELIECAAMLRATREGRLDRLIIPNKPLDILAQQIVAASAGEEWDENELYERVRSAYPYRDLSRAEFDDVVQMLAEGFTTRRGRRSAHIHYDGINHKLKGRRGARIAAITSGGAIPDLGAAIQWLVDNVGRNEPGARLIVEYLGATRQILGTIPTQQCLVLERFFDEAGGMQLVLHAPFGSRINRAWGLALRKRFCRSFNFELQAAATEDAIIPSLGPQHS